jgi:outer membrane protein TolC
MVPHLPAALAAQAPPAPPAPPASQTPATGRVLTLDDALALAEARNEQVIIAESGVRRARAGQDRARSEKLPQLAGSASYDRTLQSEFEGLFDTDSTGGEDGPDFSNLPFGQANAYRLGLSFSQLVWSGGRVAAQEEQARLGHANATLALGSTKAQLALDVAQAFYDAALADRVVAIAEESYAQADRTAKQVQSQREAGRVSEFELLRAQVDRDTLRPPIVRGRATRDVAYLRLKQLLDLPLDAPLQLAAALDDDQLPPAVRFKQALADAEAGVSPRLRTAVSVAENDVLSREEGLEIVKSQRKPLISLNSIFGLVQYPDAVPNFDDWRTNWTVGAAVSVPILTGGRIKAEEVAARADIDESKARLQLTKELADLDGASARAELRAARAEWEASAGTIQQATRAFEIAELRYREGLSTQLELADSRLLLAQAQFNRARAARDLQMTRVRFALLPELPLATTGSAAQAVSLGVTASSAGGGATAAALGATQAGAGTRTTGATPQGAGAGTQGGR